jgi:predicted nucleic acid-binding Zn ribbon protein
MSSDNQIDKKLIHETAQLLAKEFATGKHTSKQMNVQSTANTEDIKRKLESARTITCEQCDNHTFNQVHVMKRLSALVSPTGEEVVIPLQTFQCTACSHINNEFLPNSAIADIASRIAMKNVKKQTQS